MKTTETNYEQQAIDFLAKTNTAFTAEFLKNGKHFPNDKEVRDIYKITLKRGQRTFSFNFGQSIMNSQYYQDPIKERTYTLNGGARTGNYSINDVEKYKNGFPINAIKLIKGTAPTAYDVLTSLTKYDPGTFDDFCSEFGYDEDSKSAEHTYNAVKEEYLKVISLFTDEEIEQLREIQ